MNYKYVLHQRDAARRLYFMRSAMINSLFLHPQPAIIECLNKKNREITLKQLKEHKKIYEADSSVKCNIRRKRDSLISVSWKKVS